MIPDTADIRAATEALAMAIVSGEVDTGGADPVRFAADLLRDRYAHAPIPARICPYSLMLGLITGGGTMRAILEMEE